MRVLARVFTEDGVERYDDLETAIATQGETWIHAADLEPAEMTAFRERFEIHQLAVEDVLDEQTRPKTEEFDSHTFVLMKTVRLSQRDDVAFHKEVRTHPVGFFIGDGWLVTMSKTDLDVVDPAVTRWTNHERRFLDRGMDFLAYRIMDAIVDDYFGLLDEIGDDIETVEERVLDEPDPQLLEELNDVRRDLLAFRKVASPTREAVGALARGAPAVAERNEKYFRDVYDHLIQVVDRIETYRDLTSGSRDIYLNTVTQSTNEVMKTLTVVATIFIPLTFVAGVYGMNFAGTPFSMPELHWTYGYPAAMLGMAAIAVLMLLHFRRQDWL